jgi:proteasome lid subunit RPN8/RPN11
MSEKRVTWRAGAKGMAESHARAVYPHECCGILVGTSGNGEEGTVIFQAIVAENVAAAERHRDRYVVDPLAILRADRQARDAGLEIVGFYHSHPDHPAIPSATDGELAWPAYLYVIVSVEREGVAGMRAWRWPREGAPPMECPMREEGA